MAYKPQPVFPWTVPLDTVAPAKLQAANLIWPEGKLAVNRKRG